MRRMRSREEKPRKREDRKMLDMIGGERWLGPENDEKIDAPDTTLGNSQVHTTDGPDRPSLDVDKRRRNSDVSRQDERRSQ